jgi:hypothetical protein
MTKYFTNIQYNSLQNLFNDETLAFGANSILFLVQCSDVKIELIPFRKSYTYFVIAITRSSCVYIIEDGMPCIQEVCILHRTALESR